MGDPIRRAIADWHAHLRGELALGLDALLHDDCVFYSPVVFTPQRGRAITKLYLQAAQQVLPGDRPEGGEEGELGGSFRYTKEILSGSHAALEFETQIDGRVVNGVDLITCDEAGRITEFRVMLRPLQAVDLVHAKMRGMLERMKGATVS